MFGIGETELVIIVVFAFLLFGPDKLPGMGRTLGRVLRQFREASDGFTEVVQTNIMDPASEELEKSPKQRARDAEARFDEDADREPSSEQQEAPRRETFAERRARLKAEAEAAEAAAVASEAPQADESQVQGPVVEDVQANEPAADDQPQHSSAASLYAMTSRKSSRTLADEAKESLDVQTVGEEDGSDEA